MSLQGAQDIINVPLQLMFAIAPYMGTLSGDEIT